MSKNKAPKCKNMMYTQQAGHLPPGIKTASDLAAHIENVLAPKEYAVILHDQDISEDGTPAISPQQPKRWEIRSNMSRSGTGKPTTAMPT